MSILGRRNMIAMSAPKHEEFDNDKPLEHRPLTTLKTPNCCKSPREVSWVAPLLGPAFVNEHMHAWQGVVVADTIRAAEVARVAAEVVAQTPRGAGLLRLRHLKSLRRCHNWT